MVLVFFRPETKRGILVFLSPGAVPVPWGQEEVEVPALAREPLLDSFLAACSASREAVPALTLGLRSPLAARSNCRLQVGGTVAPDPAAPAA